MNFEVFLTGEVKMKYDLKERLINFAVDISEVIEQFAQTRIGNYVAGQLVRSGCAPALNYGEAQSAESRFYSQNENHFKRIAGIYDLIKDR